MEIEWLIANVTAVESPDRAELSIFGVILAGHFLANSGRIFGHGSPLCDVETPSCGIISLLMVI